jgi:Tfp pilus assembly protein PilZ
VDAFPVTSEFIFEHIYATSIGDRRALETSLMPFLERHAVPFPTEQQMIYDTGEDLKLQLKNIINSYSFAR